MSQNNEAEGKSLEFGFKLLSSVSSKIKFIVSPIDGFSILYLALYV